MCNYTLLYNSYSTSVLLLSQTRVILNTTFESAVLTSHRKAQYEKQFKDWGFKKNRTKRDWEIMNRKIQLRKRTGKDSDVYLHGQLMPLEKLRKETARQGYMTAIEQARLAFGELAMISLKM
jgi:hypothetical protein